MARLGVEALAFFEKSSFHGIRSAFAHNELTRPTVASFASRVFALAVGGDVDAQLIRADAARALAELVFCVDLRMGKPEKIHVSYAGGVFGDKRLRELWSAAVSERVPRAVVAEPLGDPVAGALRLAYKEAGCESIPF
jgi:N-acetylglucosamine kinase-like BadF-type ATPase